MASLIISPSGELSPWSPTLATFRPSSPFGGSSLLQLGSANKGAVGDSGQNILPFALEGDVTMGDSANVAEFCEREESCVSLDSTAVSGSAFETTSRIKLSKVFIRSLKAGAPAGVSSEVPVLKEKGVHMGFEPLSSSFCLAARGGASK
eukprot:CAMPEP_0184361692 /NCGR_PEP_ID=MMETSP1089-20130417/131517_2 /TAXON_ID=38269 ORGANISM="Gloeochaete wittrockiana, Strain SAG46.84" /NCGR_SAMPLE_ID=MMETSP1089 /ASSEMBLY_ACC=CAM_ASM_000445 /LENGTH=148 /DNA_ID=CAMNT_0026701475 /DNA_START=66 /DNA_END=512 /DNA_ORIENTATION=-